MTLTTPQRSNITDHITGYRSGHGPHMMLIHGVGMNADYWGNIVDSLARHFTLTVIDLPGHGRSPRMPVRNPSLQQYTDAVAHSITAQSLVVGHSMGALIALDLAVRYSDLTNGIGVMNGIYRRDALADAAIKQRVAELSSCESSDPSNTLARWFGELPTGVHASASDACRHWLNAMDQSAYADAYRAFANSDAPPDEALMSIQCPALFMTGSLEPNSTPAMSTAMHHLVTQSDCIIIEDAKHMMSLTHGSKISATIINHFTKAHRVQ